MPSVAPETLLPLVVDRHARAPLHRQLYGQVRELILDGRLAPGARLPSTRRLAGDMALSRNTVAAAFDQLMAEGYVEGQVGAGTFVSAELPEAAVRRPRQRGPSARGRSLAGLRFPRAGSSRWFSPGLPDVARFPFDVWSRLLGRTWRAPLRDILIGGDPGGHWPLRAAIAGYLRTARAVRCDEDQVIVVSGAQQALTLAVNVLMEDGEAALIEDPGYPGLRGAFLSAGVRLAPGPVDGEGWISRPPPGPRRRPGSPASRRPTSIRWE